MVTVDGMLMSWLLFALVLIRAGALVVFAPFFGAEQFPRLVRVGLGATFAIVLFPAATANPLIPPVLNVPDLALLALQELSIGIVIGFLAGLVFMGVQVAGQFMGIQVGFAMVNVIDPLSDQEVSILAFFKMNLAIVLFLVANLHLALILVLAKSYEAVGIGRLVFRPVVRYWEYAAVHQAERMFVVGLRLAMPILLVMLMNSLIEGFITRTMPQMNIINVGLPLRVTVGVLALVFVMPGVAWALVDVLESMVVDLGWIVSGLRHIALET